MMALPSGGLELGGSASPAQRLKPLVQHLLFPLAVRGNPAPQVDVPVIQQSSQPLHRRLFGPGEATLLAEQPVDLGLGDHPGAEAFEKQLASSHGVVTDLLHPGGSAGPPRGLRHRCIARMVCCDWAATPLPALHVP